MHELVVDLNEIGFSVVRYNVIDFAVGYDSFYYDAVGYMCLIKPWLVLTWLYCCSLMEVED